MYKIKYIFILIIGFSLCSCVKELGNYKYNPIQKFSISNVNTAYSVTSFTHKLEISPEVTPNGGADNYEYIWTIYSNNINKMSKIDTISTESKLSRVLECDPGNYTLQLKVIDKKTGMAQFAVASLEIVTPFSRGFYLLKETSDGNTDFDIFFDDNTKIENTLVEFNGKALSGKPKSLSYLPEFSYLVDSLGVNVVNSLIVPASEKELTSMSLTDMSKVRDYNEWFYDTPGNYNSFMCFMPNAFCYACINNVSLTNNYQIVSMGVMSSGFFPVTPDFAPDAKPYELSSVLWPFDMGVLLFDKKNQRFLIYNFNGEIKDVDFSGSTIKPGVFIDELMFVGNTIIGKDKHGVMIFKDKDNAMYAYNVDFNGIENKFIANISTKNQIPASAAINNAEIIAINRYNAKYLFYTANNKIYATSYENMKEQEITLSGLPDGKITFMDTMFSLFGEEDNADRFNYFIVAVENAGKYTVNMYNMVGGKPDGVPVRSFIGDGKVAKIQRVNPLRVSGTTFEVLYSKHF